MPTPAFLKASDLASGAMAAVQIYLHSQKGPFKNAGINVINSISARYVSYYLSGLSAGFDAVVSPSTKNYLVVFVSRAMIAMFLREPHSFLRAWDSAVADIIADGLLHASGLPDIDVFPMTATAATPVAAAASVGVTR